MDAPAIIAEAEDAVGVSDTDPTVRGNLEKLVDSLQREGGQSPAGLAATRQMLVHHTRNRLAAIKWVADYPEIAEEPIAAPVFLMGLPRSGTTYLQYLFDRDPRFRLIRTWQSLSPSPPPGFDPADAERRKAEWGALRRRISPGFEGLEAMHLYDEDGSDECHTFLESSFGAAGLHNQYSVPGYFDYLMDELDLAASYRIHKRQLQLLQWRQERKPWALKYPNHVIAMDKILEVYPDARFVMTHRDPVQALASIAKLTANLRQTKIDVPIDPHLVGQHMLHFIQRHIDRIMAFDAGPHGARVVHVDYYDLVADPIAALFGIHQGLGIETPANVAEAVRSWHAANPKNARGRNDYTLEQYGLDDAAVAEQFGDYRSRFAIPRERLAIRAAAQAGASGV